LLCSKEFYFCTYKEDFAIATTKTFVIQTVDSRYWNSKNTYNIFAKLSVRTPFTLCSIRLVNTEKIPDNITLFDFSSGY